MSLSVVTDNLLMYFHQHWIRLELFPDVLVHRLKMLVDPADSSYMPSLVVVSGMLYPFTPTVFVVCHVTQCCSHISAGGSSLNNLIELKSININPTDTNVLLLADCTEVSEDEVWKSIAT